jgi:predicted dehydrogenase
MKEKIRVGIVGAGANTRSRHLPNLKSQKGVEIVGICNRTAHSAAEVAKEFGISKTWTHWRELVESNEVDAVLIGTWPYLHCPITVTALASGKHVLTEARMAMDASEARLMLTESRKNPHLVAQVVPSPYTLRVDATVQDILRSGTLGELLVVEVRGHASTFIDRDGQFHWRNDRDLSGLNILGMGIWYEAINRWVGPAKHVLALDSVFVKQRRDSAGVLRTIRIPDHVDVLAELSCGATARMVFSAVTGLGSAPGVWLHGSEGTLHYDLPSDSLHMGQRHDAALKEVNIPAEQAGYWRVEEEFINAIRGLEKVKLTTFEDGLKYMQFTEAVHRSCSLGVKVAVETV